MNMGWISIYRKIINSDIWSKPAWWLKVWIYSLLIVSHENTSSFKRGTRFFTRYSIWKECNLLADGVNVDTVDNVLRWLEKTEQITKQKTTRGMIITVCKYNEYQNKHTLRNDTNNEDKNAEPNENKTAEKRLNDDTINNNINKGNNENKRNEAVKENTLTVQDLILFYNLAGDITDYCKRFVKMRKELDKFMEDIYDIISIRNYDNCFLTYEDWKKESLLDKDSCSHPGELINRLKGLPEVKRHSIPFKKKDQEQEEF